MIERADTDGDGQITPEVRQLRCISDAKRPGLLQYHDQEDLPVVLATASSAVSTEANTS